MAGKKKGGKKGGGHKKGPAIIDGVAVKDMTRDQVEGHLERVREELNREREDRNYFQLERDKINTFWEISRQKIDDLRAELCNRENTTELAALEHRRQVTVLCQQVKHLQYEQQLATSQQLTSAQLQLKQAGEVHAQREQQLAVGNQQLDEQLRDLTVAHEQLVRDMKLSHAASLTQQQQHHQIQLQQMEEKHEKRSSDLRRQLDHQRRMELQQLEEAKHLHISQLVANHERAYNEMKTYYKEITANNLGLINALKDQLEETKKREERAGKHVLNVEEKNANITESLDKALERTTELEKLLENYTKDKRMLNQTSIRLKKINKQYEDVAWEKEVLEQRYEKVAGERDTLYNNFMEAVTEVQQKAGQQATLLQHRLRQLQPLLEQREAQLHELLSACRLDPTAAQLITGKLEDMLDAKNDTIKELQFEVARMRKMNMELSSYYDNKLLNTRARFYCDKN